MIRPPLELPRCEEIAALLSELLDGELDGARAERAGIHLATCRDCARLAAELAATVQALHGLRRPLAPPARTITPPWR